MADSSESEKLRKTLEKLLNRLITRMSTHCVRGVDKLEDQCFHMKSVLGGLEIQNLQLSNEENLEMEAFLFNLVQELDNAIIVFLDLFIEQKVSSSTFSFPRRIALDLIRRRETKGMIRLLDDIQKRVKWELLESSLMNSIKRVNGMELGTNHLATERVAAGRESDKIKIIELLLGSSPSSSSNSSGYVPVLTICGPEGIGKSSLARTVFDDSKIVTAFKSLRLWVYVGEEFDDNTIVKRLIECLVESRIEDLKPETQTNLLTKLISQKKPKFLLVLDDFSNRGADGKWGQLVECLKGAGDGSRVVLVTRDESPVDDISPNTKYVLQALALNDSLSLWDLDDVPESEQPEFKNIKDKILSKCQHRPFDVDIIGKLLRYRSLTTKLLPFMREILGKLDDISALHLSYSHLPLQLQQCFLYCGLFPKNEFIDVEKLIHRWIAQQYVTNPDGSGDNLEEIGLEYFNYLVRRSFLKEGEKDQLGNVRNCILDNPMHDLATSKAAKLGHRVIKDDLATSKAELGHRVIKDVEHETLATSKAELGHRVIKDVEHETQDEIKTRHVSFLFHFNSKSFEKCSFHEDRLRTFLLPRQEILRTNEGSHHSFCEDMLTKFQRLYVCDLHSSGIDKLPSCIQKLGCLRYLDISDNDEIKSLPKAIAKLRYLQVLNVSGCEMLEELPKNIRKLTNLRHLYCHRCWNLKYMPRGIGELTELRTLSWFVVAEDSSLFAHIAGLEELGGLKNLREVEIRNLKHLKGGKAECEKAKLKEKVNLHTLTLRWNHDEDDSDDDVADVVDFDLDLQLNENLKRLKVRDYKGKTFPVGFSLFKNVVHVSIKNCTRCVQLPALDHIKTLECLSLESLPCLEHIDYNTPSDDVLFGSLKELKLLSCPNLMGWSKPKEEENQNDWQVLGAEHFPSLSSKVIMDCTKFKQEFPKEQAKATKHRARDATGQLPQIQVQPKFTHRRMNIKRTSAIMRDCFQQQLFPLKRHTVARLSMTIQNAESFPEEVLNSLSCYQIIEISRCPNMLSLPESIKDCNSIKVLKISGSPQLEARCGNPEGADWHIIAHIPTIQINSLSVKINGKLLPSPKKVAPVPFMKQ